MQFRPYKPTKKPNYKRSLLLIILFILVYYMFRNANGIAEMFFGK